MDKDRYLVIRGEKYSQKMGMLIRWKWRVVESGTPTKPFKIPEDVNVGGIRASFDKDFLHISMPKLTHNTFSPYHVFHIHSSHLPHRPHQPHKQEEEDTNSLADKLGSICEDADQMKMEPLSPGHPLEEEEEEEDGGKMSAEIPARECSTVAPSDSVPSVDDSTKKEVCVSQAENQKEDIMQLKRGDVEETNDEGVEAGSPDAEAKEGARVQEEGESKVKKGYYHEKLKEERYNSGNGYVESDISEHPKPFLCGGISQMFSSIAAIARPNRRSR